MSRAYSVKNVLDAKFKVLPFEGKWKEAVGCPEFCGTWFVFGPIKNGKTSGTLQLCKYLAKFGRVLYNSVEEGLSLSIQEAYKREEMIDVSRRVMLVGKESVDDIIRRLEKHCSPDVVVIDTIQFWELSFKDYKRLKLQFPNKLFIYISHVEGSQPDGLTARKIWRDANVAMRIEGFKIFPVGRYGGGEPITINERLANEYWGLSK